MDCMELCKARGKREGSSWAILFWPSSGYEIAYYILLGRWIDS